MATKRNLATEWEKYLRNRKRKEKRTYAEKRTCQGGPWDGQPLWYTDTTAFLRVGDWHGRYVRGEWHEHP